MKVYYRIEVYGADRHGQVRYGGFRKTSSTEEEAITQLEKMKEAIPQYMPEYGRISAHGTISKITEELVKEDSGQGHQERRGA